MAAAAAAKTAAATAAAGGGAAGAAGSALKYMAAGWGLFTGTHLVMSHPPVREALVKATGSENNFRGLYSAVAAATFLPTTFVYVRYARGKGIVSGWTELTQSSRAVRLLGNATKLAGAITYGQAVSTPSNMEKLMSGHKDEVEAQAKGIFRITRHPLFTSLALLGIGNILTRGFAGDVVYWAGYPLIWLVGCPHQDARLKATGLIPDKYFEVTSFLPFAAIAAGKNSLQEAVKEFNKPVLITSIAVPIFFL